MPNEFKIKNGLLVDAGGAQITGSLAVSGSLVLAGSNSFTGSVSISGSLSEVGLVSIQGTSGSDGGQLGAELLSAANWTSGSAWTGTFGAGFTHVVGNTTALTNTLAAVNGTYYYITWTVTGRTAGSFTISFGGYTSGNLTATGNVGPRATSTAALSVTPTTDFDGTVVLSIRVITASSASIQLRNSTGTITNEIRNDASNTNLIIGTGAGARNLGTNNTFVGSGAGNNNTTGVSNTLVGLNSGQNNTIGSSNVFIGQGSGFSNTTGGSNSFFGWNSGNNNTTGGNNSFFGLNSGRFISSGANLTVANNSVFLGVDTRANADSETNQLVVGYQAIGLGSNTTVIGNSSTTFGRWWGNLLIGTSTNAGFALDVNGTARVQGNFTGTAVISAATEYRLSNFSYTRIAILNNSGGFAGGYNLKLTSDVAQHDSLGAISGYYCHNTGYIDFFSGTSQAAGTNATRRLRIENNGNLTVQDSSNLVFGTTTGTKIGTATSQKIGFWNATPINQPTTASAAATLVGGGGTALTDTDTFDGYTLKQVVKALRDAGLLA